MNLDERIILLDIPEGCDLDYQIQLALIEALGNFKTLKENSNGKETSL